MSDIVKIENLKKLIIEIRNEKVLLDADLAAIYGVETKRINEAVKNNPDKFPQDYMFGLSGAEFADLRSKISTSKFAKTRVAPNGHGRSPSDNETAIPVSLSSILSRKRARRRTITTRVSR